jgi:hypothetical protein
VAAAVARIAAKSGQPRIAAAAPPGGLRDSKPDTRRPPGPAMGGPRKARRWQEGRRRVAGLASGALVS